MKKIGFLLSILCLGGLAFSQHTVNRFSDKNNNNIPYANMKMSFTYITEKAGNDSANVTPLQFDNYIGITIANDSITLGKPVNTYAYVGDKVMIVVAGTSGKKLKFNTSWWKSSASSFTTSTKARLVLVFLFDGVYWVQESSQIL
jgi:hypothetical protein